jgi:hypothetical protein
VITQLIIKIRKRFRSSENVLFITYLVCDFTIIFKTINKIDEIKIKFWQIINMNVGFLAFSIVSVCNKAVNPIYDFLGASQTSYLILPGH